MRTRKRNSTGFKGVSFIKRSGRWQAVISTTKGKQRYLGVFATPELASEAYNKALERQDTVSLPIVEPATIPGARWITLTKGRFALVDEEDYTKLVKHVWCLSDGGYAESRIGHGNTTKMHRLLLETADEIDHINCDRLDNRKQNLRVASGVQNRGNVILLCTNTSGYKGVSAKGRIWRAYITKNHKYVGLGSYETKEEAALAYDKAAREYFGEFARLNFPNEGERGCR